ncbi:MAG: DUF5320 domain-containing protein [Candidatus Omnitrophica bacterium]|nr:DUF5320 domain-containing protein [Candidatus Omnitrophota bacterium]
MPHGDGTGPFGFGPKTGRMAGCHSGYGSFGRCRFLRCRPPVDYPFGRMMPSDVEKNSLIEHTKCLEARLAEMKKRIAELEKDVCDKK